ncbi:c-type cytochrome biogenesis protein CcmI [Thalassospiraceae bacterium LMO-JJ14]|nr:c-type cytochrome biogenesis protein CcmI [Thalassospiraceae bacterium LMO-JJ14]
MTFWVFAGLLSAVVLVALLLPQFRAARQLAGRSEYDVTVYKDQLSELDRDLAEGRIAVAEADAARLEIQRRLLAAADAAENEETVETAPGKGRFTVIVAALIVPLAALGLYMKTGTPGMPDFPMSARTDLKEAPAAASDENNAMRQLATQLEARLRANDGDADGWILLARTYGTLGEQRLAAAAYQRAVELSGRDPELLADWAETRLMARDGNFTPEIFGDFLEAREKNPLLPKPWFYIGLDKAMGGDLLGAAQIWTDLLAIQPKDAPFVSAIRSQIKRAAEDGGFAVSDLQPSENARKLAAGNPALSSGNAPAPGAQSTSPAPPGPTREDVEAAQQMTGEEQNAFIRSMVARLAEKLEANPNDPSGWQRLIRAYEVLGETEKAEAAKKRLKEIQAN